MPLDRRRFLRTSAAALPLAALAPHLHADGTTRIERVHAPQNLESNFADFNSFLTPTDAFYVRNHFPVLKLDAATFRLKVEGAVEKPLELSLDDLRKLAVEEIKRPLTMECAGNGRVYLTPPARGVNWQQGAVGTADWTGLPLSKVLDAAGVKNTALEVILEGADRGTIAEPPSPGAISFSRSLPLAKARQSEVMLAWEMNGEPLRPAHGAPLRAVVGGWYGMASVKWLARIIVVSKPFQGFFQSLDYSYFQREGGLPSLVPITAMQVKSQIAQPSAHDVVPAGKPLKIVGAAWAGEHDIAKVEVSTDAGKSWAEAKLDDRAGSCCWRWWEFEWKSPAKGQMKIMSRATDNKGNVQPMERDADKRTYMISHVVSIEIEVR